MLLQDQHVSMDNFPIIFGSSSFIILRGYFRRLLHRLLTFCLHQLSLYVPASRARPSCFWLCLLHFYFPIINAVLVLAFSTGPSHVLVWKPLWPIWFLYPKDRSSHYYPPSGDLLSAGFPVLNGFSKFYTSSWRFSPCEASPAPDLPIKGGYSIRICLPYWVSQNYHSPVSPSLRNPPLFIALHFHPFRKSYPSLIPDLHQ